MKKLWLSLICLLLAFSLVLSFAGCKKKTNPTPDNTDTPAGENTAETEDLTLPFTETWNYLPDSLMKSMKHGFEDNNGDKSYFSAAKAGEAPYALMDVFTLTNCRVKSITVPVFKTLNTDADGNFTFTVFVGANSWSGLQNAASHTYTLKVNAQENGLTANNQSVFKYVTIKLDEPIVLAEGETMAYYAATDTLIPGLLSTSASQTGELYRTQTLLSDTFIRVYSGAWAQNPSGTDGLTHSTLVMDFELERYWEHKADYKKVVDAEAAEEAEFQRKLAAVKEYYQGKNLSLMGDSISTFNGVTDNTSYRNSLIANRSYYWPGGVFKDYTCTYWGTVQSKLEMNLCVIDGWSSSRVYGGGADKDDNHNANADNMLVRSDHLHRDNGMQPDLIIINMGINDVAHTATWGDLYNMLDGAADPHAVIDEWFAEVQATAAAANAANSGVVIAGQTYTSWPAAYALGLQRMKAAYPNAKIYCMTLVESYYHTVDEVERGSVVIRALAEYFGVGLIDQNRYGYIDRNTCHAYGYDTSAKCLHPNLRGHQMMARCIIEELYKGLPTD